MSQTSARSLPKWLQKKGKKRKINDDDDDDNDNNDDDVFFNTDQSNSKHPRCDLQSQGSLDKTTQSTITKHAGSRPIKKKKKKHCTLSTSPSLSRFADVRQSNWA